jgi:hypothetical protein
VLRRVHEAAAAVRKAEHLAGFFLKKILKNASVVSGARLPTSQKNQSTKAFHTRRLTTALPAAGNSGVLKTTNYTDY